jgi:hypothetical protein
MFELKEPTSAKLKKAEDKAIKIGQKDLRAAALITLEHTLPNTALEMFDSELRQIFYGPGSPGEKGRKQAKFDGMDMVQDRPALTPTGQALATLNWGKEQTGCTLSIDQGTGGERANLTFKDGTFKDAKVSLLEGGAVKVRYKFHAPVDHLTASQLGQLHLLHQRDVKVTLTGPDVDGQTDIEDDEGGGAAPDTGGGVPAAKKSGRRGSTVTPIQALKKAEKNAGKAAK